MTWNTGIVLDDPITERAVASRTTIPWLKWAVAATGLVGLALAMIHVSLAPLDTRALIGTYSPERPWMLSASGLPQRIDLEADGRLRVVDADGRVAAQAGWWWDASEGWVCSDEPKLDHRIRGYSGWTGVTLLWRLEEPIGQSEEVALERLP